MQPTFNAQKIRHSSWTETIVSGFEAATLGAGEEFDLELAVEGEDDKFTWLGEITFVYSPQYSNRL